MEPVFIVLQIQAPARQQHLIVTIITVLKGELSTTALTFLTLESAVLSILFLLKEKELPVMRYL